MVYMKYLLGKTGLFPKYKPQACDVLSAAFRACDVKDVVNSHGRRFYYVTPMNYNIRHMYDMVRVFRANGVFLRPCRDNENGGSIMFRVPNRGQRFMRDVMRVNENAGNFQSVLAEYNARAAETTVLQKMFGKFENGK
ncbi:MAG: hypothetical protein IJQ90_04740 [Alphaproteobacteria bacterium]|nr:hypothetical protein [Alphaproteobacteria bacterium]